MQYFVLPNLSLVTQFNLPLSTTKKVENGVIEESFVAASVGSGIAWVPARITIFKRSHLELELGALACYAIGSLDGTSFFPLLAGRMRFVSKQGFALFIGSAFALSVETVGVFYGIGHRF